MLLEKSILMVDRRDLSAPGHLEEGRGLGTMSGYAAAKDPRQAGSALPWRALACVAGVGELAGTNVKVKGVWEVTGEREKG